MSLTLPPSKLVRKSSAPLLAGTRESRRMQQACLSKSLLPPPRLVICALLASLIVTFGTKHFEQRYQKKECYRREGEKNGQEREHKNHTDKGGSYTAQHWYTNQQ